MIATVELPSGTITVDLSRPIDISLPLASGSSLGAWYVDPLRIAPVKSGDWTGSVKEGGSVNFNNIYFNPHGHGTHTECVGHIAPECQSVNDALKSFFFLSQLITVTPQQQGSDKVITESLIKDAMSEIQTEAIIIRTLPNGKEKMQLNYSNTNPPYLEEKAALLLRKKGIKHLLIDLPSVDKERDDGLLLAHRAFWHHPEKVRNDATITEFIYVDDAVADGIYLLNLQTAPFVNDASPSRPVLYAVISQLAN